MHLQNVSVHGPLWRNEVRPWLVTGEETTNRFRKGTHPGEPPKPVKVGGSSRGKRGGGRSGAGDRKGGGGEGVEEVTGMREW